MNAPGRPRSARDELLDEIMAAARREEAMERRAHAAGPRARRHRRRIVAIIVALGLGAAAAAGAADLISTGEPVHDKTPRSERYQPHEAGAPTLVAKASDPAGSTTWGVGIFTSAAGLDCAVAGQVRGVTLGLIRNGTFHPYERGSFGTCAGKGIPIMSDRLVIGGPQPRTIVFGRTRRPDHSVVVESGGKPHTVAPAAGGAFLFVFEGKLRPDEAIPHAGAKLQP
ncbi:hypothetical protein OM076_08445 [Solirubrobacter ginsenosidimutans]|uniref:Uncharacterized protein n=1 Tax=Solirubrobacter ginsenosidimutans TaxID=490573 RepID=A0A9X3RYY6_9ACTN|nr:hypothetical protein [Solirubrobacter ginsenosidimutans]MDA0160290.1 hypothetical protein [Solirubrobacter ginsenosidimutans]